MNCKYCNKKLLPNVDYCIYCFESKTIPSKFKYIITKFKIFFKQLNKSFEAYRNKHNFIPTDNNPIKLKKISFYSDYFLFNNKQINYSEIYAIKYKIKKKYINGIRTDHDVFFCFYFKAKVFDFKSTEVNLSVVNQIFVWRKRELTLILLNWMLNKTKQYRLNKYLQQIREGGCFVYGNVRIFNNGDLYINSQYAVNLKNEFEKGNIWYGVSFKSIFGQNLGQDPYFFRIKSNAQKATLFGKREIDINTDYNKDIFDLLIEKILKNGQILEK